jgi:adenylosuccinate synthase
MEPTRYTSVLGLGFGDCGKGRFIAALSRRWRAHTVVRFNGGAQAGHNVLDEGRHHTFSQFGAGTFTPGVRTLLLDPFVLHPTALLVEAEALARIGVTNALSRLVIDGRCRLTTPYHQAAGRIREILRGSGAHGTCGVGVGETVRDSLDHPDEALRYRDLTKSPLDQLHALRGRLFAELLPQCDALEDCATELRVLQDESLAARWLTVARALTRHCPSASTELIHDHLHLPGAVLFEGAQGVLLDEWRGFHPHTTWSSPTTATVDAVASRFALPEPVRHLGVLRSYLTRHGAGPFPTHDPDLDVLPEPHNTGHGWQGAFRRGHPDAVLLRYALESVGKLSGLLVSHLDVFDRPLALRWCGSYDSGSRLPLGPLGDLDHQEMLTRRLARARPNYDAEPIRSATDWFDRLATVTNLAVVLQSRGTRDADVQECCH